MILCGTRTGCVYVTDCRNVDEQVSTIKWDFGDKKKNEIEVEKVIWNHFNPFCVFAVSSDGSFFILKIEKFFLGKLRYLDTRKPNEVVAEVLAHDDGANSVSQSFFVKGLVTTVGTKVKIKFLLKIEFFEEIKIWKLKNDSQLQSIYTHSVNMGNVSVTKFSTDSATTLAIGAQGEELIRVFDLAKFSEVVLAFNSEDEVKMA